MRPLVTILMMISALVLLAGFGGRLHGAGDLLAVGRPAVTAVLTLLSLVAMTLGLRRRGAVGLMAALVAVWSMLPPMVGVVAASNDREYGAYQKNLLFRNRETEAVAADILATESDFVFLQELHSVTRPILARLGGAYPHQAFCDFATVGGVAVLSRWPPTGDAPVCDGNGLVAMQVETPDGPLWVASLHLHWPYPHRQPGQVERLLPVLRGLDGPVLLGGDFNMVPWGYSVRAVAEAIGGKATGYAGGTFTLSDHFQDLDLAALMPRLPIDHVLVPAASEVKSLERRERLGSDHNGLLAKFTFSSTVE